MSGVVHFGHFEGDLLRASLSGLHYCGRSGLSAVVPKRVLLAMQLVVGVAGGACCTNGGQVIVLRALVRDSYVFNFSEPSRTFVPFVGSVSIVRK